jgi:hypothetical protein
MMLLDGSSSSSTCVARATATTLTFPMCFLLGLCLLVSGLGRWYLSLQTSGARRSWWRRLAGQPARKCVDEKCIFQAQTILCFATRGGSIIEVTGAMDNAGTLTRLWSSTLAWRTPCSGRLVPSFLQN